MEISRMNIGKWNKVVAFFDLKTSEGFTIKGFKIIEGPNGKFVGFPSVPDKEKPGDFKETIWAEKELKEQVSDMAMEKYLKESKEDMPF